MRNAFSPTLLAAVVLSFVLAAETFGQRRDTNQLTLLPSPSDRIVHAVAAADNARVLASLTADDAGLRRMLSETLTYQHSNGATDTKESLIEKIVSGRTRYKRMDYLARNFTVAADDVVLMHGRVHFHAVSGERELNATMSFLAVWRLEQGEWRFFAWQSANVGPPPAPTAPAPAGRQP
jgi:hypothetical protein